MAGNKNSGRKPRSVEQNLHSLLDSCWPIEHRKEVIRTLHKNALEGSYQAASLLLAYTYGKPTERIEHSVQLDQAKAEYQKLRAEFPDIEAQQLAEWLMALKGIQSELISEVIQ